MDAAEANNKRDQYAVFNTMLEDMVQNSARWEDNYKL